MVRNIVGCLVYVGKRKYPPEWIRQLLEGRRRSEAAPTFPPDGLYLTGITYDDQWEIPAPAEPPPAVLMPGFGRLIHEPGKKLS